MGELRRRQDSEFYGRPNLEIISRKDWGAQPPREEGAPIDREVGVIVATLNTETPSCATLEDCVRTVKELQRKQMENGSSDIQYNFLIASDGRVYEGRGWKRKSCPKLPTPDGFPAGEERLDIAFIGDHRDSFNPPLEMLDPSTFLVMHGVQNNFIKENYKFLELDKRYMKPENEPTDPDSS